MGPVLLVVLSIAAVSFAFTKLRRAPEDFPVQAEAVTQVAGAPSASPAPGAPNTTFPQTVATNSPLPQTVATDASLPTATATNATPLKISYATLAVKRPPKVRNLLLRLEAAEKMGNIEMEATTIEALRSLPGEPAADIDDILARRLGQLNLRWLFALSNRQWVAEVTVRTRETAARIAAAHGSTLASLIRLNALKDADNIRVGQTLKVMNHPRFSLTVHRRARYADLHLNGKFFNRYDISGEAQICEVGVYKTTETLRDQLPALGLKFSLRDRIELETLIPAGASIVVSET